MSRRESFCVEASPEPDNDRQVVDDVPVLALTPELEAGLLALAPLLDLVQARRRGRQRARRFTAALPPRPEVTPEMKHSVARSLERKGFR